MATGGIIGTSIFVGLIILAVMALFVPIWVMQIRDRAKAIDQKLSILISILNRDDTGEPVVTGQMLPPLDRRYDNKAGKVFFWIMMVLVGLALVAAIGMKLTGRI